MHFHPFTMWLDPRNSIPFMWMVTIVLKYLDYIIISVWLYPSPIHFLSFPCGIEQILHTPLSLYIDVIVYLTLVEILWDADVLL